MKQIFLVLSTLFYYLRWTNYRMFYVVLRLVNGSLSTITRSISVRLSNIFILICNHLINVVRLSFTLIPYLTYIYEENNE